MILLDFVADRDLSLPREANSDRALWRRLRRRPGASARRPSSPPDVTFAVTDDHCPS